MDILQRAKEIVQRSTMHSRMEEGRTPGADWVMSVIDEEGYPAASMITAAAADGFRWIAFCTGLGWNKPNRLQREPRSCIYLFDEETFSGISLAGKAEIITDPEIKRLMWYDDLGATFRGPEDDRWCVLMFRPEKYNIFMDGQSFRGKFTDDQL